MSLRLDDLTVYYQTLRGDVQALESATFVVADGEIMGLAGESGCGKTTMGHSLVLHKPPMRLVRGGVALDGEPLPIADSAKMNAYRWTRVSMVPQYAMNAMNPTLKIGSMTRDLLGAKGVDVGRSLAELRRRLEVVKLSPDVLDMYPIELSGGMKQRMVMVLSTLLNPSLLIADEITSALDVSSQKAVARMLAGFRDEGFVKSMIVITHDISVLYQIADTIMVMYAGQLAEKAPTEAATRRPLHPYTRLLISSLPEAGVRYAERRLTGIPGSPPLLLDPPAGCRFRARCPVAFERCEEVPPFREVEQGHFVACWREAGDHA